MELSPYSASWEVPVPCGQSDSGRPRIGRRKAQLCNLLSAHCSATPRRRHNCNGFAALPADFASNTPFDLQYVHCLCRFASMPVFYCSVPYCCRLPIPSPSCPTLCPSGSQSCTGTATCVSVDHISTMLRQGALMCSKMAICASTKYVLNARSIV
jgi:hypothetical protein